LLLLIVTLAAAGLALLANSVRFTMEVAQGRLGMKAYNSTIDFGPVTADRKLLFYNLGPSDRQSPNYLLRESNPITELVDLLDAYAGDETGTQKPIILSVAELKNGPVGFRFWNPFYPAVEVRFENNTSLGNVRFRVHETNLEIHAPNQNRSVQFPAPLGTIMMAGALYSLFMACALLLILSLVWDATSWTRGGGAAAPAARAPGALGRLAARLAPYQWVVVFGLGTLWIGYVHFYVFHARPAFGDEMNYLIQARILAAGHVMLPQPQDVEFFKIGWMDLMVGDGKIWNFHAVGHSILLAIGLLLGSPSIVPPLVGGGLFAALFSLARRLVGSSLFAWLCVLVAASSQYVVTLAGSFMAHAPALLFVELAFLSVVIFLQTGRERHVVLAGAFFGAAFLVRPLSAVLTAAVPCVILIVALFRRRVRFRTLVVAALLGLAIASLDAWRTYLTTGQFTLAYMAKGPEANMTLANRWARGWPWRIQSLYLYYKYYHNRLFGLGFIGNLVFFFVPLVAAWRRSWVWLSYVVIVLFWTVHSFLHFYGWGWEPRMVYEFSHLTMLLTAYGMWLLLIEGRGAGERVNPVAAIVAVTLALGFLSYNFAVDLPRRFTREYANYSGRDPSITNQIKEQHIDKAVLFYREPNDFAQHAADNQLRIAADGTVSFTGNIVHAIHLGNLKNQTLISKYPDYRVFFAPDKRTLQETPNFYRETLPQIAGRLSGYEKTHERAIGIPWLSWSDPKSLSPYKGVHFFDDRSFYTLFGNGHDPSRPWAVASVGALADYARVFRAMFSNVETVPTDGLSYPVSIMEVDPSSRRAAADDFGFQMNVYRLAADFKAAPFESSQCLAAPRVSERVGFVYFDASDQAKVCADWSGEFHIDEAATYTFAINSDDGAGIVIDGRMVLDNGMFKSQGITRRESSVYLGPGQHAFYLSYVQVAGPALLEVDVRRDAGSYAPLNMASFDGVMHRRRPEQVADKVAMLGLKSAVMGVSLPLEHPEEVHAGDPIIEITDAGAEPGSVELRLPRPYHVKRYPLVQFYYKMPPDTGYSMMVRVEGEDEWKEIPMRIEQPVRDGTKPIGAFNADQDDQWHLMRFDLYKALGSRDVVVYDAILGEWAGATNARTLYLKDLCLGPAKATVKGQGADNQMRLIKNPQPVALGGSNGAPPPAACPPGAAEPEAPVVVAAAPKAEAAAAQAARAVPPTPTPTPIIKLLSGGGGLGQAVPEIDAPEVNREGMMVSSSRESAPELAARAIDGDRETRWDTGRPQQGKEWFRIDLAQPIQLAALTLDTGTMPDDYARQLEVHSSEDGKTFALVAELAPQGSPTRIILEKPVTTCSIRLDQTGQHPWFFWSINELEVFGTPLSGTCGPVGTATALAAITPTGIPTSTPALAPGATPEFPPLDRSELEVSSFRKDRPELAQQAIDDLGSSRWDSGKPQTGIEWFQIDLPGEGELSRILLHIAGSPMDYPRLLQVSVSLDGREFTPAALVKGRAPDTVIDFRPAVRCRAVRLEQQGSDPVYFWAINDLTVWGRFPKRQRHWWQLIPMPGAWVALLAVVATTSGALVGQRYARGAPARTAVGALAPAERRWRTAGMATTVVFAVLLLVTQSHYGETWDEWEHFLNGEEYYQYLFAGGRTPELYGHVFRKYYAPFSDIIAALIKHTLHDGLGVMSAESAFHLHLNLLFAASGLVAFRTILPEYGGRAAYLSLVALFASPHLLGHCHNNMKDFAVTAWTLIAVFAFHTGVRRRSYPRMAVAGLLTGVTIATKVNGVILGPIFLVYVLLFLACSDEAGGSFRSRLSFAVLGCALVFWTMAFGSMVLLWPWLWADPVGRFLETVRFFQHHIWNGLVLYKGKFVTASQIPRDYAPYYVLITTPIAWLPFVCAGLVRGGVEVVRRRLLVALVGIAFLAPIIVEVLPSAPIYDGVRHFLPAFPFLACLVGFGLDWMCARAPGGALSARLATAVAVLVLGSAIVADIRIHPYQSTFFNSIVGGGKGAMGRFELDYWANSLKEAGAYVNEHAPPNSRVHVVLDLQRLARLRKDLVATSENADYAIVLNRESLAHDPYKDRQPIYNVTADGAVLTKVYRLK
jgi:hypothetical protein